MSLVIVIKLEGSWFKPQKVSEAVSSILAQSWPWENNRTDKKEINGNQ